MNSTRRSGFSLLELVIVIALMAIMAVAIVPNLRKSTTLEPKEFVVKLNALMQTAWQQAVLFNRVQRVKLNFADKKIVLFEERTGSDKTDKESNFVPVTGAYLDTQLAIPPGYSVNTFYVDGKDNTPGTKLTEAHFFVMPSGVAQAVILNMSFVDEDYPELPVWKFGMVLNPFSAQFEYYDTFQRP